MSSPTVRLPERVRLRNPVAGIVVRVAIAVAIVLLNWGIVLVEARSYTDSHDGSVSVVDALYYTTVTLTTTGYGDITPVTTGARLVNALLVTPMRLVFVVLLVGTTIKALTQQSRTEYRLHRWRNRVNGHTVVVGYGTKGRNAARALLLKGVPREQIVVLDSRSQAVGEATEAGYVAVQGNATSENALRRALVDRAASVILALDRDDTSILATLTIRQVSSTASVIVSAREAHNADLLRQSGASSVIVTSETTGRLLGLAADSPETVAVVEDLVAFGSGLDLTERPVAPDEVGRAPAGLTVPVLAVLREGRVLHYDDRAVQELRAGDVLVHVTGEQDRPG